MRRAIADCQPFGVEVDIWKIEESRPATTP
jgi:hypothetical protein